MITIDTYVHVIMAKDGSGSISDDRIQRQLAVLNAAFAGSSSSPATPFVFRLAGVDRTKNTDWHSWTQSDDDVPAKNTLHRGDLGDLNLYVTKLKDAVLGYTTFPSERAGRLDGVVVLNSTLPGGTTKYYNLGDTAVHEVGHWLGLFHTFQGGCTGNGDFVTDTPAQASGDNKYSCDEALDTCKSAGTDPVHNYLSYGDDVCLDRFTPGQVSRMIEAWQTFRAAG